MEPFFFLPSQDALLQRLQHLVSFGKTTLLVIGAKGSGKTTFATSICDLDYNTAFINCPMHIESSEVREKILVQLFGQNLFDCDMPLAEIIMENIANRYKNIHIIIDNAHYLPLDVLAECIILPQISLPDFSINVTLTAIDGFEQTILNQLLQKQKNMLLTINISPLSYSERESLYSFLVKEKGKLQQTSTAITKRLLKQQRGTPQEVIDLIDSEITPFEKEIIPKKPKNNFILFLSFFFIFCTIFLVIFIKNKPVQKPPIIAINELSKIEIPNTNAITITDNYDFLKLKSPFFTSILRDHSFKEYLPIIKNPPLEHFFLTHLVKPRFGYTIQVLNTKNKKYCELFLKENKGLSPMYLLKKDVWYTLVFGEFNTKSKAYDELKKINSIAPSAKVHKWEDLRYNQGIILK